MRMYEMKFDQFAVRECICLCTFPTKTKRQQQEKQIIKTTNCAEVFAHFVHLGSVIYRTKYSVIDKMRVVTKKKISENVRRNLINSHLSVVRLM
jgi:hypothetical protein